MAGLLEIPTDPRQRILRIPRMGPDRREMVGVTELEDAYRSRVKAEHVYRVQVAAFNRKKIQQAAIVSAYNQRQIVAMCKKDIVFWFDHFACTWDDRLDNPGIPFVLYPQQRKMARYYAEEFSVGQKRQTWFVEKSRGVGYSWLMAGCLLWSWLFRDGDTTLMGAVKLDDIDNGGQGATLNCHLGRIRYMISRLPEWMRPAGIESEVYNKKLLLSNPTKDNNVITGRQMDSNLGRMGRFSRVCLDEIAHTDDFDEALTSVASTTRRIWMGTTPKGRGTASAALRFSGQAMQITLVHWSSNPMLDADWYWEEVATIGPARAASELDISYDLSAANRVFKAFDPDVNISDVKYDKNLPLHVAIDPGFDDACAILWIQPNRADHTYQIVDFAIYEGKTGEWFVPLLLGYIPTHTLYRSPWPYEYDADTKAMIDRHGAWNPIDEAYGDAGGAAHTQTTEYSLYDLWVEYGVAKKFGGIIPVKHNDKTEAVRRAEIALPRVRIARSLEMQKTQSALMPTMVDCFQQYTWVDRTTNVSGRNMKREPKHDIYSHAMDAWQFYLAGKQEDVVDAQLIPLSPGARHLFLGVDDATGTTGSYVPEYTDEWK